MAAAIGIATMLVTSTKTLDAPRTLRHVELIPLIVDRRPGVVTNQDLLESARSSSGRERRMAIELLQRRGVGEAAWGYVERVGEEPSEWWTRESALDEGTAVADELEWRELWLVEAIVTGDGDAFATGEHERVR